MDVSCIEVLEEKNMSSNLLETLLGAFLPIQIPMFFVVLHPNAQIKKTYVF
jgi:hypothetical protein